MFYDVLAEKCADPLKYLPFSLQKKAVRIFNRTAFYQSLLLQPQKRLNSAIGFPL